MTDWVDGERLDGVFDVLPTLLLMAIGAAGSCSLITQHRRLSVQVGWV